MEKIVSLIIMLAAGATCFGAEKYENRSLTQKSYISILDSYGYGMSGDILSYEISEQAIKVQTSDNTFEIDRSGQPGIGYSLDNLGVDLRDGRSINLSCQAPPLDKYLPFTPQIKGGIPQPDVIVVSNCIF